MKYKLIFLLVFVSALSQAQPKKTEWTILTPSYTYEGGAFSGKGSRVPTSAQVVMVGPKKFAYATSGPLSFYDNGAISESGRTVFDVSPKQATSVVSGGMTNNISSLYVDGNGTLWFVSSKGFFSMPKEVYQSEATLDNNMTGKRGIHYKDIPVSNITSITGDNNGKTWVAGDGGIASYDGKEWKQFPYPADVRSITSIVANGAEIFVASGQKVAKFDGTNWSQLGSPGGNITVISNVRGTLYCGTSDGVYMFANGKWTPVLTDIYSAVTSIHADDHAVWIGTLSGGVFEIFPNGSTARIETKNSPLPSDDVKKILVDGNNTKWFVTQNGVAGYKEAVPNATRVEVISRNTTGFPYEFVEDAVYANNRWNFSTSDAGLVTFDGQSFKRLSKVQETSFNGIAADKNGKIYLATSRYLYTLNGDTYEKWELKDQDAISKSINDVLVDDKGQIWLAHNKGVSKFDGTGWQHFDKKTGLSSNSVTYLFMDSKSNIWIISNDGLSKYNGTSWENFNKKNAGVILGNLKGIAEHDGKIYTSSGWALIQYDGTAFSIDPSFKRIDGDVNHFTADAAGNFWFATHEKGLVKFNGGVFTYYNMEDGLPDNHVQRVFTRDGEVWASSGFKQQSEMSFGSMGQGVNNTNATPPKLSEKEIVENKVKEFDQQFGLIKVK